MDSMLNIFIHLMIIIGPMIILRNCKKNEKNLVMMSFLGVGMFLLFIIILFKPIFPNIYQIFNYGGYIETGDLYLSEECKNCSITPIVSYEYKRFLMTLLPVVAMAGIFLFASISYIKKFNHHILFILGGIIIIGLESWIVNTLTRDFDGIFQIIFVSPILFVIYVTYWIYFNKKIKEFQIDQ